jgi:hypothetical protein
MAKRGTQVLKFKDYGDDWINRLAVVVITLKRMEPNEREAALEFIVSKYLKRAR